jgi:hypothetical protein
MGKILATDTKNTLSVTDNRTGKTYTIPSVFKVAGSKPVGLENVELRNWTGNIGSRITVFLLQPSRLSLRPVRRASERRMKQREACVYLTRVT